MVKVDNLINYLVNTESSDYTLSTSYTYKKNLSRKIYSIISETSSNKNVLINLINKSKELKNVIDKYKFSQTNSSINLIEVSDPSKLEATLNDNSINNDVNYIKINKLASTQEVNSKELRPEDDTILEQGLYKFSINVDNTDIEIDLSISKLNIPKNKDLLNTLAYLINRMDIGLKADVYTTKKRALNPKDPNSLIDYVYLKITNNTTGSSHYFELLDVENNLVSTLELDKIENFSKNAEYYFNTTEKSTPSNETVEKNGKLVLKFLGPTHDFVYVKSHKLNGDIVKYISNVIEKFNEYMDWIYKRQNLFSEKLVFDTKDIFSKHYHHLKEMDLILNQNDNILVGTYFQDIIKANPTKYINYLFGESGFFTDLRTILNKIINSPGDYQLTDNKLALYSKYGNIYLSNESNKINTIHLKI